MKNLAQYWSGLDNQWLARVPQQAIPVYVKVIKNGLQVDGLSDDEKELLITGIDNRFFTKSPEGLLKANFIYLSPEVYYKVKDLAEDLYGVLKEVYADALTMVTNRLDRAIPDHVRHQAGNYLSLFFRYFATFSLARAKVDNLLSEPEEEYKHLLSLYVHELLSRYPT